MYFAAPSTSHVMSGFFGSSTMASTAAGSLQSIAVNRAVTSSVIHARSVGSVGVAPVVAALGAGVAEALGDGVGAIRASGTALLLVGEALLAVVGVADGFGLAG